MGSSLWRVGVWASLSWASAVGCSGSSSKDDGGGAGTPSSVCAAGAARCDGLNVKVCNAEGTAESIQATCLPSQSCSEGACRETACVPNTRFCREGSVWKCDSTGGGSALTRSCNGGEFCRESEGDATCSDQACLANEPLCLGSVATTCKSDGSGPQPGGTDCAETEQACYQGECRDVSCTAGTKVCQHDDVYVCAQNGTDLSLLVDCTEDEVCDGALGACRTRLCEPGKVSCDGARVTTCNDFGSAWLTTSVDCAATSSVCVDGSCRKQVCNASSTYCEDGDVYLCDYTGSVSTLHERCEGSWSHCRESSSFAYCAADDCQAGATFCDGNVIKTCTADGSIPASGTTCKPDEYCSGAVCHPRGCTLEQYFCKDGDVYYCSFDGPWLQQDCGDQSICQAQPAGAICATLPCDPGSTVCLGNKVGTCSEDGTTLGKVTTDCTATTNICTAEMTCAKTSVDVAGVAESVEPIGASTFIGDIIEVNAPRKLTEFSANLVLAGPRELRWVIYEQSGSSFVARLDKISPSVTATGFVSSGPFVHSMKAGKRYLLGVVISGGDGVAYYDTAPLTRNLSFGSLIGRFNGSYQPTQDATWYVPDFVYQLKVTTEAP